MKRMIGMAGLVMVVAGCGVGYGEVGAATAPAGTMAAGPVDAGAHEVLVGLQARKGTLKDFVGKVEYSVESAVTGDVTGKRGTVAVVMDATKGVMFTVDFAVRTEEGKAKAMQRSQIIFDGEVVTVKDFEPKQYVKNRLAPAGSAGSGTTSLDGPMTLPIGVDPAEVEKAFVVTSVPAKEAGVKVIRLVPRDAKKFEYRQLEVTVDEKLQLPVKLVQVAKNQDVTTIVFSEIEVNGGKAKMESGEVPAGWTERK